MKITGFPHSVPLASYDHALDFMVRRLRDDDGVLAVYQVGGVETPGVSDIDICVVFHDDANYQNDPLAGLSREMRYLYVHGQFGLSLRHFKRSHRYTFFHNYKLLYGEEIVVPPSDLSYENRRLMEIQTGLEYLTKMFVSMTVENTYGIYRLRNLMLLGKGLIYDLKYVGIESGPLVDLLDQLIEWRESWFQQPLPNSQIKSWIVRFYVELERTLNHLFEAHKFYAPDWANLRIAGNMELISSDQLGVAHRGITLPSALGGLGRKYFNVQHRWNRFRFQVPIKHNAIPPVVLERHEFVAAMLEHNRDHLQHFTPASFGLAFFNRKSPV